jgi:adenine-specific DNA-methyltransferase
LFGSRDVFKNPKPVELVEYLLSFCAGTDSVILDSFAGSGTTGHAALRLNASDGGHRQFILVETEDYADTLTAERLRRVVSGVPDAKDDAVKAGLGGEFSFCELGEPMEAERWFEGTAAPSWEQVARYVIYTATGETANVSNEPKKDWFACETGNQNVHVVYGATLDFMRSPEAALTLELARSIAETAVKAGKTALVFGAAVYVSARELRRLGITFVQLPWSVHQRVNLEASS